MSERQSNGIEKWMGYIAVLVATIAALAAIYEARINREHQAISVWPYLEMWTGISFDENSEDFDPFSFNLANKGVGPAIIETLTLTYKEKEYDSWFGLTYEIAKESNVEGALGLNEAGLSPGEVMEAGESRWIVRSDNVELAKIMSKIIYQEEAVTYEICYCSLYKDCWELTYPDTRPKEIDYCEVRD